MPPLVVELNLGQTSIRGMLKRYLETGSTDNRPISGKPPKTTEKGRRVIMRNSRKQPFSSPRELRQATFH